MAIQWANCFHIKLCIVSIKVNFNLLGFIDEENAFISILAKHFSCEWTPWKELDPCYLYFSVLN